MDWECKKITYFVLLRGGHCDSALTAAEGVYKDMAVHAGGQRYGLTVVHEGERRYGLHQTLESQAAADGSSTDTCWCFESVVGRKNKRWSRGGALVLLCVKAVPLLRAY